MRLVLGGQGERRDEEGQQADVESVPPNLEDVFVLLTGEEIG